jgi:hypothetical protein
MGGGTEGNSEATQLLGFCYLLAVLFPFRLFQAKLFNRRYHNHHYCFCGTGILSLSFFIPVTFCLTFAAYKSTPLIPGYAPLVDAIFFVEHFEDGTR